jgi:hypothetical protein
MSEYIEREAANEVCRECVRKYPNSFYNGIEAVRSELRKLPAADVRPVVRGEWEKDEGFDEYGGGRYVEWTCSECFCKVKGGWAVRDSHIDEKPRENFCPNCGADMR